MTEISKEINNELKINEDSVIELPVEEVKVPEKDEKVDPVIIRSVRIIKPPDRLDL